MSLLVATQITAVATVALAVGAMVTAVFALMAFRKQSAELTILKALADDQQETNKKLATAAELQADELRASRDQREREAEERHRAQASKVNAWFGSSLNPGTVLYGRSGAVPTMPASFDVGGLHSQ